MAKRPAYPNHVGTIGGTIRMGHGQWVHRDNRECLHRARIDLEAIAERYGEELSVAEFVNRSVCSECGARLTNILISLEPRGGVWCFEDVREARTYHPEPSTTSTPIPKGIMLSMVFKGRVSGAVRITPSSDHLSA